MNVAAAIKKPKKQPKPRKSFPASLATMKWSGSCLGAIYERQKFFDRAEEQFKKVLAINPRNAPVLNYYGYMLATLAFDSTKPKLW